MRRILTLLCTSLFAVLSAASLGHAQTPALQKVTVGMIPGPPTQFLPFYVAQERGLFKAPDVNLEVNAVTSGTIDVLRAAIAGGEVDFGLFHVEHVVLATGKGKPSISVVQIMDYPAAVLVVRQDLLPGLENEKDPRKIITALKGLRIGTISAPAADTQWFRHLAVRYGDMQDGKDYTFVHLGTTAQIYEAALGRKEVDAIFTTEPHIASSIYKKLVRTIAFQWDFPEYAPGKYAATSIMTTPEYVQKRRDIVARFVKAIIRAEKWMNANPEEYIKIREKIYPSWPHDFAAMLLPKYRWNPVFTQEAVENVINLYFDAKMISKKMPWDSVTTNEFVKDVQ
jgi:ABC-type nitrate/sulfonate/bicarbonate transport system substrate-binding protein